MYPVSSLGRRLLGMSVPLAIILILTPALHAQKPAYPPKRAQTKDTKPKAKLEKDTSSNEKYIRELAETFLDAVVQRDELAVRANLSKALRQAIEETGKQTVAQWAARAWPSSNLTGFEITSQSSDTERDDAIFKGALLGEINGRTVRYPFTLRIIREEEDAPYRVDMYRVDRR
jgi:hypothetical protein